VAGEVTRDLTKAYTTLARAHAVLVEADAIRAEIVKGETP